MCGRYNLRTPVSKLIELFAALPHPALDTDSIGPRFNIAPTQNVLAIREEAKTRQLVDLHWGLIPFWAKDPAIGNRMINARGETVASKPSFRAAFRRRRCLVLADGFYEWKKTGGRTKQPYHITSQDEEPLAFAGLWESWKDQQDEHIESCTIITTSPNSLMSELHDRMPVILDEADFDTWLDPANEETESLQTLIRPCPEDRLRVYPISTFVNRPQNDTPECIQPLEDAAES